MSLRTLPEAKTFERPQNFSWDAPSDVLAQWAETPRAAETSSETTITIFDVIGEDYWSGGGFTAKRASAALRQIGERDITVQINSPGGDMFEGIAIYNMLRAHPAKVTVNVLGWAASAASIITMAADEIVMGLGSFVMVHNAWGGVVGNQHDFRAAADAFAGFDSAIADIYEARTGAKRKDIVALMDAETFMSPTEAKKNGFADRIDEGLTLPSDTSSSASGKGDTVKARRQIEAALAKSGFSRAQRGELLAEIHNTGAQRDASTAAARDAGKTVVAARQLIELFKI